MVNILYIKLAQISRINVTIFPIFHNFVKFAHYEKMFFVDKVQGFPSGVTAQNSVNCKQLFTYLLKPRHPCKVFRIFSSRKFSVQGNPSVRNNQSRIFAQKVHPKSLKIIK